MHSSGCICFNEERIYGEMKMNENGLAQKLNRGSDHPSVNDKIVPYLRQAAGEGIVLLENDGVLPFSKMTKISAFGRCQIDTFYTGYGSGGNVSAPYKVSYLDGLLAAEKEGKLSIDRDLVALYEAWIEKEKPTPSVWGNWPYCLPEMVLSEEMVARQAEKTDAALYFFGRSAGEDQDCRPENGSFLPTDDEMRNLALITRYFKKVVLILNCGNIVDLSWLKDYPLSAVLYAWQGGMESGNALADVLTGRIVPCGKLPATIAKSYADYPSSTNFGGRFVDYEEDIFVGYRFFETFAPDRVLYPFGFGLSYTRFLIRCANFAVDKVKIRLTLEVENIGAYAGKEVVQVYSSAPQGKLGKEKIRLISFKKSRLLFPCEREEIRFEIDLSDLSSFDDSGKTGFPYAYVLERGEYLIEFGGDVRNLSTAGTFVLSEDREVRKVKSIAGNVGIEERWCNRNGNPVKEAITSEENHLRERILEAIPSSIAKKKKASFTFTDVTEGKISLRAFVSQLDAEDLEALTRGYGSMDAPMGVSGNAGVFGGITPSLRKKGIPVVNVTDGPSGIRLNRSASLLPCGSALASTWDTDLVEEICRHLSDEMKEAHSDVLLGPAMNLHRNPLCGRNFEYFGEDPLLSGKIAASYVRGIQKRRSTAACIKHFALNNQEAERSQSDSRISERALREIYLKGFEICIRESYPKFVMTSYNKINGVWAHYHFDLCQTLLRDEWHFTGVVMTDWWMQHSRSPEFPSLCDNAYRIRSSVDLYMPGDFDREAKEYVSDGTLLKTYGEKEGIRRGEIERSVLRILKCIAELKETKTNG